MHLSTLNELIFNLGRKSIPMYRYCRIISLLHNIVVQYTNFLNVYSTCVENFWLVCVYETQLYPIYSG